MSSPARIEKDGIASADYLANENGQLEIDPIDLTEYPTGWRFYAILLAIILTMLLVSPNIIIDSEKNSFFFFFFFFSC